MVPADYAFVAHTADPLTGEAGVTVGEVVVGMGEALVGNMPGRALSFTTAGSNGAGAPVDMIQPPLHVSHRPRHRRVSAAMRKHVRTKPTSCHRRHGGRAPASGASFRRTGVKSE